MSISIAHHKIGNKVFVGALFWQSLTQKANFRGEAYEQAQKNSCDLYMIREGTGVAQAGMAYTKEGYAAGMYSLAAALSSRITELGVVVDNVRIFPHNWLAAFQLDEVKWAFVAVRDEAIIPTGDRIGTKEEILALLDQTYGFGSWNAVIGSADLAGHQYPKFVQHEIGDFFPVDRKGNIKLPSDLALRPFKLSLNPVVVAKVVVAGLAFAGGIYGYVWWDAGQKRIAQEQAMEQARQLAAQSQAIAAATQKLPHPWATAPLAHDFASACESGFLNIAPAGWQAKELQCTGQGMTLVLERGLSTIGQLKEEEPNARIDVGGELASLVRPVKFYEFQDEEIGKLNELGDQIVDYFQRVGVKVAVAVQPETEKVVQLPGSGPLNAPPPPRPDWRTTVISLGPTGFSPTVVLAALRIPGFRFERITYKEGEWSYEGKLYAR